MENICNECIYRYHNNIISKNLSQDNPVDFTMGNIDGVVYRYYTPKNEICYKYRLIIYDSKFEFEKISDSQLEVYYQFIINIDWSKYDDKSGVFIIKHNVDGEVLKLYNIKKSIPSRSDHRFELVYYKTLTRDDFSELIRDTKINKRNKNNEVLKCYL